MVRNQQKHAMMAPLFRLQNQPASPCSFSCLLPLHTARLFSIVEAAGIAPRRRSFERRLPPSWNASWRERPRHRRTGSHGPAFHELPLQDVVFCKQEPKGEKGEQGPGLVTAQKKGGGEGPGLGKLSFDAEHLGAVVGEDQHS